MENIQQFFERGDAGAAGGSVARLPKPAAQSVAHSAAGARRQAKQAKKFGPGSTIEHAKYGRGTVLRLEGSGDDTKVTVNFPGLRVEETNREIRRNQG